MASIPAIQDPSGILPAHALNGAGMAGMLIHGTDRATFESSPQAEQKQWFTREVQPHEPALRSWLARNHPALRTEMDDIVQESYLRLIRAKNAGPIRCARTYLFGIARYVALGIHRAQRNIRFTPVNDLPESDTIESNGDVVAMVTHNQELALTAQAIRQLPERCREVVTLHTVEGLSYREIAGRMGLAEETVRVQMARAVKKCVAFLRERSLTEHEEL